MIETGKAIGYGWSAVKKDFWYFVGIAVIAMVISGLTSSSDKNPNSWDVLGIFLSTWMTCGYTTMMLSYQAGKKMPLSDVFTQFKHYWRVLGASILVGLIVVVGLVLLIVPGVYFALRFQFVLQLIIDKNLGIGEAMSASTKLTNGIKMPLLGFNLTLLGVIILGALCLGVGILVAMPVVWLAQVHVYRQLAAKAPAAQTPR